MKTILLYTNSFSPRELNQILTSMNGTRPQIVRDNIDHSAIDGELKTTGYNSKRFMELYVPDNRVEVAISFLNKNYSNLGARTIETESTEVKFNAVATAVEEPEAETRLERVERKAVEFIDQVISTPPTQIEQQALTA